MNHSDSDRSLYNRGQKAHVAGDLMTAATFYEKVLASAQPDPPALRASLMNLAALRLEQGDNRAAEPIYRRLLSIDPDNVGGLDGLGLVLRAQGRLEEAIAMHRLATTLSPDFADAYANLGICLTQAGQLDAAEAAFTEALRLHPDVQNHFNLAGLHRKAGRFTQALSGYDDALSLSPGAATILMNRGIVLDELGRTQEAIDSLERAATLTHDNARAQWNLSQVLLRAGQYERAWPLYEARWRGDPDMATGRRPFTQPQWDGRAAPQGVLLIHGEQGLGDVIQMARFIPMARAAFQGGIVVEVQKGLFRLLAESFTGPGVQVVERAADFPGGTGLPAFTTHIPITSLPGLFRIGLMDIPKAAPYLMVPEKRRAAWVEKMTAPRGMLRVGLVWRGNPQQQDDRYRSLPAGALDPLRAVPNVAWFLLQKHEGPPVPAFADMTGVTDLAPLLDDFADTAAAMAHLDLVISVCTSAAHLAGACKRPLWILLGQPCCWRWLQGRSSSPWYPSATLFRSKASLDWGPVVGDVARRLRVLATM